MTQDRIIDMAKQAGFHFHDAGYGPEVLHTEPHEYSQKCFERLAALLRAQALEEAAKKRAKPPRNLPRRGTGALLAEQQYCYELGYREGAAAVRAAIRALKERLK